MEETRRKKRILVCGGRDYADTKLLERILDCAVDKWGKDGIVIIHGGARGADSLAGRWAEYHKIECIEEKADWKKHGKSAGPIRNQKMLDEHAPDIVVAFPGGTGTAHMVKISKNKLGEENVLELK
jgi:hypothetical protein